MAAIENSRMRDASFGSDRLDLLTRIELEERGERSGILSALLIPHPDDLDSEGVTSPRLLGGTEYVRENIHMVRCMQILPFAPMHTFPPTTQTPHVVVTKRMSTCFFYTLHALTINQYILFLYTGSLLLYPPRWLRHTALCLLIWSS